MNMYNEAKNKHVYNNYWLFHCLRFGV